MQGVKLDLLFSNTCSCTCVYTCDVYVCIGMCGKRWKHISGWSGWISDAAAFLRLLSCCSQQWDVINRRQPQRSSQKAAILWPLKLLNLHSSLTVVITECNFSGCNLVITNLGDVSVTSNMCSLQKQTPRNKHIYPYINSSTYTVTDV